MDTALSPMRTPERLAHRPGDAEYWAETVLRAPLPGSVGAGRQPARRLRTLAVGCGETAGTCRILGQHVTMG